LSQSRTALRKPRTWSIADLRVTLQTTWGSREGADASDNFRMIRLPEYTEMAGSSSNKSTPAKVDDMDDMDDMEETDSILGEDHALLPQYVEEEA
jgi:hypothetical protein